VVAMVTVVTAVMHRCVCVCVCVCVWHRVALTNNLSKVESWVSLSKQVILTAKPCSQALSSSCVKPERKGSCYFCWGKWEHNWSLARCEMFITRILGSKRCWQCSFPCSSVFCNHNSIGRCVWGMWVVVVCSRTNVCFFFKETPRSWLWSSVKPAGVFQAELLETQKSCTQCSAVDKKSISKENFANYDHTFTQAALPFGKQQPCAR
jgi:hypothetical protein